MYIVDHPLYPYIVDVGLRVICYGLYKFETTVGCRTLLFSLGTHTHIYIYIYIYIYLFPGFFLNIIKVVPRLLCCWFFLVYI